MATIQEYVERRVKELLAAKWEHSQIIQQLGALTSKKQIEQLIQDICKQTA